MKLKRGAIHVLSKFVPLTNAMGGLLNTKTSRIYAINSGIAYGGPSKFRYTERLVELPFLFSQIKKPAGSEILDIGCSESITPIQLAMMGYRVTGIDIRDYGYAHKGFSFIKDDFITHKFGKKFDIVIDISALEHFGLGYKVNKDESADVTAVNKVWNILKPGGQFIFTAPFGSEHKVIEDFERVYSRKDIDTMFKRFKIRTMKFYKVTHYKHIEEISETMAKRTGFDLDNGYAVVCMSMEK